MKTRLKLLVSIMVITVMISSTVAHAATGTAKMYYDASLNAGHYSRVRTLLSEMGYSVSLESNPSQNAFLAALSNNKVFYYDGHGASDGSLLMPTGEYIFTSEVTSSLSNLKFAFLQTCYSSAMANRIYSKGASASIGFNGSITAVGSTGGNRYYTMLFFGYAKTYNIAQSHASALSTLYAQSQEYYGMNNCVINGGSVTIY